jgi:hypothetical protein
MPSGLENRLFERPGGRVKVFFVEFLFGVDGGGDGAFRLLRLGVGLGALGVGVEGVQGEAVLFRKDGMRERGEGIGKGKGEAWRGKEKSASVCQQEW